MTTYPADRRQFSCPVLSGPGIVRLMRQYRVTIAQLSERTGLTQVRIRFARRHGLRDRNAARDWVQAITGADPGPF